MGAAVVTVLWNTSAVLLPFFIGILIAYVLAPAVSFVARKGVPRLVAVLLAYLLLFGSASGFILYLMPQLQSEAQRFARRFQGAPQQVTRVVDEGGAWLEEFFGANQAEISSQRAEVRRALSNYGLGPDTYLLDPGSGPSVPLLMNRSPQAASAPGTRLSHALGLRSGERNLSGQETEEDLLVASVRENEIGIRLGETTLEFEEIEDGVFSIAPRRKPTRDRDLTPERIQALVRDALTNTMHSVSTGLVGTIVSASRGLASWISQGFVTMVVILMVAGFILLDLEKIASFFRNGIPAHQRSIYEDLLDRLDRGLSGVVRGQLIICLINGILSAIGFFIFVPEYAVVLAVFATVMTLIPIFGTIISTVPACVLALSSHGWGSAFAVLAWILAIHFIEANILNPKIMGASARISPVVVVFVLVAGEHFFGLTGALLAVPSTALVIALGGFIYARIKPELMRP